MQYNAYSILYLLGFFEESWQSIAIIKMYDATVLSVRHFVMN